MSLLRYDPFTTFFDDTFDQSPFFRNQQLMSREGWQPTGMRSQEDDKNIIFQIDIPGVKSDDLKMKLNDNNNGHTMVHVSGERKFRSEDGFSVESSSFERQFSIGPNVDKDKIAADLKEGVLTITIPKKEAKETSPTYIPITSSSGATEASE